MNLALKVYTDESLIEVKRVVEVDRIKIPYRVAMTVAQTLDSLDLDNVKDNDIIKLVTNNLDKVDKIIKATFGVTDTELECVDVMEMSSIAMEIYSYAIDKINSLKGDQEKN